MTAAILFAPGAGAPSTSTWMRRYQAGLERVAHTVAFDYPYRLAGRRTPDPLPKLIAAHRQAIEALRKAVPDARIVLAGKSMGGRVGCHASLEEPGVAALVCFGYPLRGAGKTPKLRDAVLLSLTKPVLFVQGTRDPLCPLPLLDEVRQKMNARSELLVVEGGNHSLEVDQRTLRASGETQAAVETRILHAVEQFVAGAG